MKTQPFAAACLFLGTAWLTLVAKADTSLEQYQDIVIAPKASPMVRKAATDLQYHLQKIANRPFPLVESDSPTPNALHFIVGDGVLPPQENDIAKLPREGWMIRSVPNGLLLAGNDKGTTALTFYPAVSLFLEKYCGVRWLWPGQSGEVIPQNPKLNIRTLDESGAPALKRRKLTFYYARWWDQQTKDELQVWMARARLGDQLRASFGHAWESVIPADMYFKDHPEWFGLVSGQRVPLQKCPSNMEMRAEFVKRLLSLPHNKNLDIVSVSPSDGYGFCECELCKAKGTNTEDYQTEAYWDFVRDIAQRVKALRPDLGIGTFAYTFYRNPPKKIDKLPDNVHLSITTYATQLMRPEEKAKYEDFINEWKPKGAKITTYQYWGMHYWMDLPVVYPDEIATSFRLAMGAGMMGAEGEAGKNFSTQAPNYYMVTHLMWDPKADPKKILDDFYSAFGPAEKPVRSYFELMEQEVTSAWNKYKFQGGYSELISNYGNIFTPSVMSKAAAYLDEASRAAGNDAGLKERIDFIRVGCEYTTLMGELLGLYDKLARTGFPLEGFEWEATAAPRRYVTKTPTHSANREEFEARLKQPLTYTLAEKDAWLLRAWDLGQKRIEILNRNRKNFALDEGLYATTLEGRHIPSMPKGIRRWQQTVGKYLGKPESEIAVLDYTPPVKKQ